MSSEPVTITAASARSNLSRSPADRSTVDSSAFAQGHGEAKPAISPHTRFVARQPIDRKSTRLNSSHGYISYAVFCLKKKKQKTLGNEPLTVQTRPRPMRHT